MRREYCERMGWEPEIGVPVRTRLEKLGIGWAAGHLAQYGKLRP